jgi:hypothetical protein
MKQSIWSIWLFPFVGATTSLFGLLQFLDFVKIKEGKSSLEVWLIAFVSFFIVLSALYARELFINSKKLIELQNSLDLTKMEVQFKPSGVKLIVLEGESSIDSLVLLFDQQPWLSRGRLVSMKLSQNGIENEIALVGITGITSDGFPQGIIIKALKTSKDILSKSLIDNKTLWPSIYISNHVEYSSVEGNI